MDKENAWKIIIAAKKLRMRKNIQDHTNYFVMYMRNIYGFKNIVNKEWLRLNEVEKMQRNFDENKCFTSELNKEAEAELIESKNKSDEII